MLSNKSAPAHSRGGQPEQQGRMAKTGMMQAVWRGPDFGHAPHWGPPRARAMRRARRRGDL